MPMPMGATAFAAGAPHPSIQPLTPVQCQQPGRLHYGFLNGYDAMHRFCLNQIAPAYRHNHPRKPRLPTTSRPHIFLSLHSFSLLTFHTLRDAVVLLTLPHPDWQASCSNFHDHEQQVVTQP